MSDRKKRRPQLLSSTRPRNLKITNSASSKATRTTVRTYHTLKKQLSSAVARGDDTAADKVRAQIEESGGIGKYQQASILGQSAQRGGDTSKVLVEWMLDSIGRAGTENNKPRMPKMLEVGALRVDNACSKSGLFDVERIDLHSQHPEIEEQDFMQRPVPTIDNLHREGFDVVSLSLVVNFVGDPAERGEMLQRVGTFLRHSDIHQGKISPALFLVLPAPCVTNSRYLDEDRLESMMKGLGYKIAKRKMSAKLVYYFFIYGDGLQGEHQSFKKEVIKTGKSRNNFAIVFH